MRLSASAFVVLCIATMVFAALWQYERNQNNFLQWKLMLADKAKELDRDLVHDLQIELYAASNRKTYEEGFADALIRQTVDRDFTDAYTRGYHQAISQNQDQITDLTTRLHDVNNKIVEQAQP